MLFPTNHELDTIDLWENLNDLGATTKSPRALDDSVSVRCSLRHLDLLVFAGLHPFLTILSNMFRDFLGNWNALTV